MTHSIQVLIVGAGPTGLTMAIECCRYKIPFRLIEKLPERAPYSKALAIWQGSLRVFAAQGILAQFKQQAVALKCAQFAYKNKVLVSLDPVEGLAPDAERPLMLAQSETEKILSEHLMQLGGKIERGLELIAVRNEKNYAICELKNIEGMTEVVHASWLIACDGARSVARKYLESEHQTQFKGYTEEDTFQLGDFEFTGTYHNDHVFMSFTNNSTLGLLPVSSKVLRLIAKENNNDTPTLANFQALLKNHHIDLTINNPLWLTTFQINERLATHWVKERIILVGDAAHIHSPAGGQGMNTGIQDAFNLGWKLAHVLSHPKSTELLISSYQEERYPIVKKIVAQAAQKLHFAMKNNAWLTPLKRLFLTLAGKVALMRKNLVNNLSELYVHYHGSELINDGHWPHYHDGVASGRKIIDVTIINAAHNQVSLFNTCVATAHVLLIFALDKTLDPQLFKDLPKACKLVIVHTLEGKDLGSYHFSDPQGRAHQLYGANEPCWYLIRPDQFIAKRGYLTDIKPISDYFRLLFA